MVPGCTSANFQQCDIAVMHLSITVRPRQRLFVQLLPFPQPPLTSVSRASSISTAACLPSQHEVSE